MTESLSAEWVRKTHSLMPWTSQELAVKELLLELRLSFRARHVFQLPDRTRLSIDFLVFARPGIALECTSCTKRRGSAIAEVMRRCAFVDYRFTLLKRILPRLLFAALVEAPKEDQLRVEKVVVSVLGHWNVTATSVESLRTRLSGVVKSW